MKKILSMILTVALAVASLTPIKGLAASENLTRWATITTDIPYLEELGPERLNDGKNTDGMVTDGNIKPSFPYHIELDFGGYTAEMSDLRIYSCDGKGMGVTNLGIDVWQGNSWKTVRSGEILSWNRSEAKKAESRDIHFSSPVRGGKFRIVIKAANLKEQSFRIDELEMLGSLVGIRDKKQIANTEIAYFRCEKGGNVTHPGHVKANLADGSSVTMGVEWGVPDTSSEGVKTVTGYMPYYDVTPYTLVDVFDADKDISAVNGTWAEDLIANAVASGLLGGISADPGQPMRQLDAALILFRNGELSPVQPKADSSLNGNFAGKEMAAAVEAVCGAISAEEPLTRAKAASWIVKMNPAANGYEKKDLPYGDLGGLNQEELAGVEEAFSRGVISKNNSFRPGEAVTLAELLAMQSKLENGGEQIGSDGNINRTFTDSGEVLVNPYMGIFSYYLDNGLVNYDIHYDNGTYFEDVPGLSNIYIRIPWSVVQPEKGIYDFSMVDGAIEKFKRVGKQISLRFTASETGHVYATPKWVFDEGAKIHWWGYDSPDAYSMPYFDDPIFLANLDVFLGEVAKRYDGNPNIAYIDVGSLGIWGEGHTGSAGYKLTPEAARMHMELHAKHFKKTKVVVLDDMGQNFNDRFFPEVKNDVIRLGFGLRNDGYAGVDGKMRFILPEDKTLGDGIWEHAPIVMEPEHYGEMHRLDIWGDGVDFAHWIDIVHGTYIGLHGFSKVMAEENPEFMEYANKRIGYRIIPETVRLTSETQVHGNITLSADWKNVAAAPCYNGAYPAITLKDMDGNIMSVMVDSKFNVDSLPVSAPGKAKSVREEAEFRVHDVLPGGTYQAFLSLGNITGSPEIKMPIEGNDGESRYYIGDVTIKGDYELTVTQQSDDDITLHFELSPSVGEYVALWGNISMREQGGEHVYMPGDIVFSVNTSPLAAALKTKSACDIPVKLSLNNAQFNFKKSVKPGMVFDVHYDMDTLGGGMTPGMMMSGNGRSPKIGTAVIQDDLSIKFQPLE